MIEAASVTEIEKDGIGTGTERRITRTIALRKESRKTTKTAVIQMVVMTLTIERREARVGVEIENRRARERKAVLTPGQTTMKTAHHENEGNEWRGSKSQKGG